jgi:tetratricopeptide (TPR) repeat protein
MRHVTEALEHEEKERKTRNMISGQKLLALLEEHKKKGNDFYKTNKFDEAIDVFTKGIEIYKENREVLEVEKCNDLKSVAIGLFTNRSLVYSKKKLDANVIADTTFVIDNLTKKNVKAYYRRAMAYKSFGQYKESLSDLNAIIKIEPKNEDANVQIQVVKKLFEEELKKQFEKQNKAATKPNPKEEAKSSKPSQIERPKIEEITDPISKSTSAPKFEQKKKVKIDSAIISKAAELASKELGKDRFRVPSTSYSFEADLNSLKKTPSDLYAYLSHLPASTFSKVYKNIDIQADYMMMILSTLSEFETSSDRILEVLYNFSLAQNISMTMMFLSDTDTAMVKSLISKCEESTLADKSSLLEKVRGLVE